MGGLKISKNLSHMSKIGKLGGLMISKDRKHMSKISRGKKSHYPTQGRPKDGKNNT